MTKSRFLAGLQCLKRQWWEVHGPPAEEEADLALENRRLWGRRVDERARVDFGPGVLIDRETSGAGVVEATRAALAGGATRIYQGAFEAGGLHVEVDALEKVPGGWRLIEVKSSTSLKAEHVPDAAVQAWTLRRAGLTVKAVEVAHLNREATFPDLSAVLVRVDVTSDVNAFTRALSRRLAGQLEALGAGLPEIVVGAHCRDPRACPFLDRCWGALPEHHLRTLYYAGEPLLQELERRGVAGVADIPADVTLSPPQDRQRRAVQSGALVVDAGLDRVLAGFSDPIAFLDFETVSPAIPVWDGCAPYTQVPVQFACEQRGPGGERSLHEHLAEPGSDPRPALAQALLDATRGARTVFAYYARFEIDCIRHLARTVPSLARPLEALAGRMADLLPVVRNHVYHPAFHGRFSLKDVLPALLPHLAYDDLAIQEGGSAAALLERMLVLDPPTDPVKRARLRTDLLAYCRRDVVGLSALFDWLRAHSPKA